jgi:uncharacterized protein (TIGR03083 family)
MTKPQPIHTLHLFPVLEARLVELLRGLDAGQWDLPTLCPGWRVKDVAAHLLDTLLRRLSIGRDGYFGETPEGCLYQDSVAFLNRLNADWVRAAQRLSPRLLVELMEQSSREVYEFFQTLDPRAPAQLAVSWAGEETSANWFDIAREYTERWHHQQQIRLAVGREGITGRELYFPVLDTFMRALPHTYREVAAPEGALLQFDITGEAGGSWFLLRESQAWRLGLEAEGARAATVTIPQEIAWRVFTKGIDKSAAQQSVTITGDEKLGGEILNMLSVMA